MLLTLLFSSQTRYKIALVNEIGVKSSKRRPSKNMSEFIFASSRTRKLTLIIYMPKKKYIEDFYIYIHTQYINGFYWFCCNWIFDNEIIEKINYRCIYWALNNRDSEIQLFLNSLNTERKTWKQIEKKSLSRSFRSILPKDNYQSHNELIIIMKEPGLVFYFAS